jgi:hypothetical protein
MFLIFSEYCLFYCRFETANRRRVSKRIGLYVSPLFAYNVEKVTLQELIQEVTNILVQDRNEGLH